MENTWDALHLDGAESGDLRLRLATETDLPVILRMVLDPTTLLAIQETAEYAEQNLRRLWQEEPAMSGLRHFVVERACAHEVIAYLRLEYPFNEPGCLWLTFLCIVPRYRGRRYGRRIMELLTVEAAGCGCVREFGMHTMTSNSAAIRLYQSSGFVCVKREPWQSSNGDSSARLTFRRAFGETIHGVRRTMSEQIRPRRIEMWEFLNEGQNPDGSPCPGRFDDLTWGGRRAAEFFIDALTGCRRILDTGCGGGLPALYLAERVGSSVVGLDAGPNMVSAARANAGRLGLASISFELGGIEALRFGDREFDGASICGALESMDWSSVLRTISEVRRVLEPGGRLAVLEQDWRDILKTRPKQETCIRFEKGRLWLQFTERRSHPHLERQTRYFVAPESVSGQELREELGDDTRRDTTMAVGELRSEDIIDAWWHETAQFDSETLADLLESNGFRDLVIGCERVWTEEVLLVTAVRA